MPKIVNGPRDRAETSPSSTKRRPRTNRKRAIPDSLEPRHLRRTGGTRYASATEHTESHSPADSALDLVRNDIKENLSVYMIIPIFVARDLRRVAAVTSLVADGIVSSEHLPLTELVKVYDMPPPDLTRYREARDNTPVNYLIEDVENFRAILSACQSSKADPGLRRQALDPSLATAGWTAFTRRAVSSSQASHSGSIQQMLLDGLEAMKLLPPSIARAEYAKEFARSVALLDAGEQEQAFRAAVGFMTDLKTDALQDEAIATTMLYECAVSLRYLCKDVVPSCANVLTRQVRTKALYAMRKVHHGIGEAVGLSHLIVWKWDDQGELHYNLRNFMRQSSW